MAEEVTHVNAETQKTATEDGKTQTAEGQGTKQTEDKPYTPPARNDGEDDVAYYKRVADDATAHANRRKGEADHYRVEYRKLQDDKQQPVLKQVRTEVLLNTISDATKRKAIEKELSVMEYSEDINEVQAAFRTALDHVEAPIMRKMLQGRGQEHLKDLEVAGAGAGLSLGGGSDKPESTLHPEAQAIIAQYKKDHKTTKK